MNKKLQVFVSSTYTDLINERQAAVEAILSAGHIPAGMELFSAGNESQLEVIKRWINESDVYMLILGGRYGSIEHESGKSYTQLEYEYALEINKPIFSIVIDENALFKKAGEQGKSVMEAENPDKYEEFKKIILTKMCKFFEDIKDIQLAIHTTLSDFNSRFELSGWISGKELQKIDNLITQNSTLIKENDKLKKELEKISKIMDKNIENKEKAFKDIMVKLIRTKVIVKKGLIDNDKDYECSALELLIKDENSFATGITNKLGTSDYQSLLYYKVAPVLMRYGLVAINKVPGVQWEIIRTTKEGFDFLRYCHKKMDETHEH